MKNGVMAILAAGALLLSAGGSALASDSIGGTSGGADEFLRFTSVVSMGAKIGGGSDGQVVNVGAKLGAGMDGPARLGGMRGIDPGKTTHSGSV